MKFSKLILYVLLVNLLAVTSANAWDGKRQGFLLGLGMGYGNLEYSDVQSTYLSSNNQTAKVSGTSFMPKIGYAFTDDFALLYYRHPFNFNAENSQGSSQELTACAEVIGFNYYFGNLYLGAGSGNSYFFKGTDNYEVNALQGTGAVFSLGYEFSKHYAIEFTSMSGTLENNNGTFQGNGILFNFLIY